ncbi:MAG: hypothetical protein AAF288_13900 [Planctomycetota bacterium]
MYAVWRDQTNDIELKVDGASSTISRDVDPHQATADCFAQTLARRSTPQQAGLPPATLSTSLAHLQIVNGALQAAPIHTLPAGAWRRRRTPQSGDVRAIHGIEGALAQVSSTGQMLCELNTVDWTRPASHLELRGYQRFDRPKLGPRVPARGPVVTPHSRRSNAARAMRAATA